MRLGGHGPDCLLRSNPISDRPAWTHRATFGSACPELMAGVDHVAVTLLCFSERSEAPILARYQPCLEPTRTGLVGDVAFVGG